MLCSCVDTRNAGIEGAFVAPPEDACTALCTLMSRLCHRHGPLPSDRHGEGSLEHLTLALAAAPPPVLTPLLQPFERVVREHGQPASEVPALVFLSAQRAQAPPA